jgi:hypothetical protein
VREALDQWHYVIAAYALGIGATLALVAWSWFSMIRAEARRDAVRSGRSGK